MSLDYIDRQIIRTVRKHLESQGMTLSERLKLARDLNCSVDEIDAAITYLKGLWSEPIILAQH